jgi:hypothetical protein
MAARNAVRISTHFWLYEFASPDTGAVIINPVLLYRLELLRLAWGDPLLIASGYRSAAHNADPKVGGLPYSRHLDGRAVDLPIGTVEVPGPHSVAWWRARGRIPSTEVDILHALALRVGWSAGQVLDEGDHVHLEVD